MTLPTNSPLNLSSVSDQWQNQFRMRRLDLQPTKAEADGNAHKLTSLVQELKLILNRNAGITQTSSDVTFINHFVNFFSHNESSLFPSLHKDDNHKITGEKLQTALKSVSAVKGDDDVKIAMNQGCLLEVNNEVFKLQGWLGSRILAGGGNINLSQDQE